MKGSFIWQDARYFIKLICMFVNLDLAAIPAGMSKEFLIAGTSGKTRTSILHFFGLICLKACVFVHAVHSLR